MKIESIDNINNLQAYSWRKTKKNKIRKINAVIDCRVACIYMCICIYVEPKFDMRRMRKSILHFKLECRYSLYMCMSVGIFLGRTLFH